MSEIIKFIAQKEHVWEVRDRPFPAAKKIPQNWKDIPKYANENNELILNPAPSITVKMCVPTLEMFTSGYYMPLWADCLVKQEISEQLESLPRISWTVTQEVFGSWDKSQLSSFEIDESFSRIAFKYYHGWTIKTPPGWSCLFIHPVAYPNLPFKTVPGIVHTDIFDGEINTPILIKKNFEGIIEKGTPMFQIIPFKRSDWNSEFDIKKPNQHFFDIEKLFTKLTRSYASLIKDKRKYN
jgi:hypothetical protein